jgi:hypothetical protein
MLLSNAKKNILMDGIFSKMIYIHPYFSINGIYVDLPIHVQKIENISNDFSSKHTVHFLVSQHSYLLHQLELLEKNILDKYIPFDSSVPKIYSIMQTMKFGYFRVFREASTTSSSLNPEIAKKTEFILKISGIWENAKGYGLSYKMVETC